MMIQLNQFSRYIFLLVAIHTVLGADNMDMKQCRGVDIEMAEDHAMHMNECLKAAGAKEVKDIASEKIACFGKCVFVKKGLIDAKGNPHKEKILNLITDNMPKVVHDDLNKRVTTCLLPNTTTDIIDPEDVSCTTYLPMLMCIHLAFMEECDNS